MEFSEEEIDVMVMNITIEGSRNTAIRILESIRLIKLLNDKLKEIYDNADRDMGQGVIGGD